MRGWSLLRRRCELPTRDSSFQNGSPHVRTNHKLLMDVLQKESRGSDSRDTGTERWKEDAGQYDCGYTKVYMFTWLMHFVLQIFQLQTQLQQQQEQQDQTQEAA